MAPKPSSPIKIGSEYLALTTKDRIVDKVLLTETGCWQWMTPVGPGRYPNISFRGQSVLTHRLSYTLFVGEIPPGMEIDHLCRNTNCVSPLHLEAVTTRVNQLRGFSVTGKNARKTYCKNGHEFDAQNTHIRPGGGRTCKACHREKNRIWTRAHRQRERDACVD